MAYIRRRGTVWQATVRLPSGERRSISDPLRRVVAEWAADMEADARRGETIDPRSGRATVGELWRRYAGARHRELASRRRDESHWRCHVAPRWADVPVGTITRPDVSSWVVDMQAAGVGGWTIRAALGVLRGLLSHAVDARIIRDNPAMGVRTGRPPAHTDRVLHPSEDAPLTAALERVTDGAPRGRLLAELMLRCGLRWEEAAALSRDQVLLHDRLIHVTQVLERDGSVRRGAKSAAGQRMVPVPDHLWPALRQRAMASRAGRLLITTASGTPLSYATWRTRVWLAALHGVPERPRVRGHAHREAIAGAGSAM